MIDHFLMAIIIAVITGAVILVAVLVWLIRSHLKLKRDYQALTDVVHSHNNDIADLFAAALAVDGHIVTTNEQINTLYTHLSAHQPDELSSHPYGLVIQKVRKGASVNDLMQNSGLSQDEATLLIRLHGSNVQS